jgi:tetratricopeptide (TPR) repeat protein
VLLWGALRDVRLWTDASGEQHDYAFETGASEERLREIEHVALGHELDAPLRVLAALAERPGDRSVRQVLGALHRIVSWAEASGAPETQLAFTQASALMRPRDPQLALAVGRLARDLSYSSQAESWFRRSIALARRVQDWSAYAWSYNGLGVLYLRCGNGPAARSLFERALRVALRRRLHDIEGAVHHHLFHLATEAGQLREAYEHIRAAVDAYGPSNTALSGLLSDVGRFWLHVGAPGRALPLFEAAVKGIEDRNVRAMVFANVARAAAVLGDHSRYEAARHRAVDLITQPVGRCRVAETWASLAYADLAAEAWDRAEAAAVRASTISQLTREAEVQIISEQQLLAAREHRALTQSGAGTESPGLERQSDRLAQELLAAVVDPRERW